MQIANIDLMQIIWKRRKYHIYNFMVRLKIDSIFSLLYKHITILDHAYIYQSYTPIFSYISRNYHFEFWYNKVEESNIWGIVLHQAPTLKIIKNNSIFYIFVVNNFTFEILSNNSTVVIDLLPTCLVIDSPQPHFQTTTNSTLLVPN